VHERGKLGLRDSEEVRGADGDVALRRTIGWGEDLPAESEEPTALIVRLAESSGTASAAAPSSCNVQRSRAWTSRKWRGFPKRTWPKRAARGVTASAQSVTIGGLVGDEMGAERAEGGADRGGCGAADEPGREAVFVDDLEAKRAGLGTRIDGRDGTEVARGGPAGEPGRERGDILSRLADGGIDAALADVEVGLARAKEALAEGPGGEEELGDGVVSDGGREEEGDQVGEGGRVRPARGIPEGGGGIVSMRPASLEKAAMVKKARMSGSGRGAPRMDERTGDRAVEGVTPDR
jgi:hypothetical protein